ncbi:MAG: hypothetical protein QOK86_05965, partial [Nitrososphaeraceae archaeon]|nr:hypothetical protein [Nitrososphaeraceae archaeon]
FLRRNNYKCISTSSISSLHVSDLRSLLAYVASDYLWQWVECLYHNLIKRESNQLWGRYQGFMATPIYRLLLSLMALVF